jgi:hypothetical protein
MISLGSWKGEMFLLYASPTTPDTEADKTV